MPVLGVRLCSALLCYAKTWSYPPRYAAIQQPYDPSVVVPNVLSARERLRNSGVASENCVDCTYRRSGIQTGINKIEYLIFSHIEFCQLSCVYCYQSSPDYPKFARRNVYSLGETIEFLLNENLISSKTEVFWGGGEPTTSSEFWKLSAQIDQLQMYQVFNSHCVSFFDAFCSTYDKERMQIVCSVDAAKASTYQMVKGVNVYNKVIDNIKHYIDAGITTVPKFIACKQNASEASLFVENMVAIGAKNVMLDIDLNEVFLVEGTLPHLRALEEALSECKKKGILVDYAGHSWSGLDKEQKNMLRTLFLQRELVPSIRNGLFNKEFASSFRT